MFNPRNSSPFGMGRRSPFGGSRSPYQALPYGVESVQGGSLISKVMLLLAFSFLFACIGTFIGFSVLSPGAYFGVAIGGLVVLIALHLAIRVQGLNLFLLYLFTFLEGMALAPLIAYYTASGQSNILGEAFLITAITSLSLAVYSWTTKRDFSRLGDYLFFGLILLLIASVIGFFFQGLFSTGFLGLFISIFGIAIFSGYVLYYVQRARYMADTMPNAILLTVSLFITVLNLFLYILEFLSIAQGGRRR
ncbi:MAG: Bax inhibitor-1 family protein [Ktedonobacteraceae bacterium]